jgi:hypothetical protein
MSAKKAKQLRKLTKAIVTQQLAQGQKVSDETLYIEKQRNRKYAVLPPSQLGGPDGERVQIAAGTIMTTTSSVRGIYKAIKKKLAKDGNLNGDNKPYTPKVVLKPGSPSQRGPFMHTEAVAQPTIEEVTPA